MARVKRGMMSHKTHKNLLRRTKGFRGTRNNLIRMARQAVLNAGIFAYRDRRNKKRDFRRQWISTINISLKNHDLTYSRFMYALKEQNIELNRKSLAEMAEHYPDAFEALIKQVSTKK